MEQDGREFEFDICNDGGYVSRMSQSYDNMVWSGKTEIFLGIYYFQPTTSQDLCGVVVALT